MCALLTAPVLALAVVFPFALQEGAPPPAAAPDDGAAEAADEPGEELEAYAGRAVGPIGGADGLLAGERGIVTFDELDDLLLWRDGRSPNGQAALRQLLELRVLADLAEDRDVVIEDSALLARFEELDAEARQNGVEGGLAQFIAEQGVDPAEFRRYLRLSMVQEELTRRALGLAEDAEVTADQQQLWLENELEARGYEEKPFPWTEGVVCVSDDVSITREEFGRHLRQNVDDEDEAEAIYLILLERAVRARMPEVTDEGVSAALDREIERRAAETETDPRYQGASYDQLLEARGLSVEALRRDPAIRAAALAHEAVDRQHDDESLRAVYEEEREFFDGLFGESVEVRLVFRNATERDDDPLRPPFTEVEEELRRMKDAIEDPSDFARVVEIHSEDRATRDKGGLVGRVTRGAPGVPKALLDAVFAELDEARAAPDGAPIDGRIVGPVRLENGVVLLMLANRIPAPTWEVMKEHVHRELRRRFLEDTLPKSAVQTYLGEK